MRIYANAYELMSEMGRDLWEMGLLNKPKTYQNKVIEGNEDFETKELICEQYCLMDLPDEDVLFTYTQSKEWCEEELKERLTTKWVNPGTAWEKRKDLWEQFLTPNGIFDYTYNNRIQGNTDFNNQRMPQIKAVIELLKKDPDTRKAILSIYNAETDASRLDGSKRIPCSMYYDFLIRDSSNGEKQLNICYHQRSSDFIQHFGNDVWLAFKLMQYVANEVGVKPGYLYHTIDSLHAYKKDWWKLKTSIDEIVD